MTEPCQLSHFIEPWRERKESRVYIALNVIWIYISKDCQRDKVMQTLTLKFFLTFSFENFFINFVNNCSGQRWSIFCCTIYHRVSERQRVYAAGCFQTFRSPTHRRFHNIKYQNSTIYYREINKTGRTTFSLPVTANLDAASTPTHTFESILIFFRDLDLMNQALWRPQENSKH